MPYADNAGVRIYYEVEGDGPPIVLVPGMPMASNAWRGDGWAQLYWQGPS